MSEPIPEAVPVATSRAAHGSNASRPRGGGGGGAPRKKATPTPRESMAAEVQQLFKNPDREVQIPEGSVAGGKKRPLPPPPEIVANVQGSSAGAGSGEFHVYKASRRREYERMRRIDEEVKKEQEDVEWEMKREEMKRKDEEKLSKNQRRRMKEKLRKQRARDAKVAQDKLDSLDIAGDDGVQERARLEREIEMAEAEPEPEPDRGIIFHED